MSPRQCSHVNENKKQTLNCISWVHPAASKVNFNWSLTTTFTFKKRTLYLFTSGNTAGLYCRLRHEKGWGARFHLVFGQRTASEATQANTVKGWWQVVRDVGRQPWKPPWHTAWQSREGIILRPRYKDVCFWQRSSDVQAHIKLLQVFLALISFYSVSENIYI